MSALSWLLLLVLVAGVYWAWAFGPAYIERFEVNRVLIEASNEAVRQRDDEKVKEFVWHRLHQLFDEEVVDHGRNVRQLTLDADPDDLRVERTDSPPRVDIWFTYQKHIQLPLMKDQERTVTFDLHVDQDTTPVKW